MSELRRRKSGKIVVNMMHRPPDKALHKSKPISGRQSEPWQSRRSLDSDDGTQQGVVSGSYRSLNAKSIFSVSGDSM